MKTFFTDDGSGQPVVMIHGWACDGSDWAWLSSALAGEYRVIVPDLRGHGRSGPADGYTPQDFADDIVELLLELKLTDVILVGHSLGGIVASLLAVSHPQLIKAIVLVDPSYGETPASMEKMLAAVKVIPHKITLAAFASFRSEATPTWLRVWHTRRILGTPADVVSRTMLGMYENDGIGIKTRAEPVLRARSLPILTIYAANHEERAEWERAISPSAEVEVWAGHGHFLHQEDPDRFAARVILWLGLLRFPPPEPFADPTDENEHVDPV